MAIGLQNTSNLTQDLARKSFAAMITRLFPNGSAPLFALSSMLPSRTALQFEHGFFTKTMIFPSVTLNGAIASGATTAFVVQSTANITPGMLLMANSTREMVAVSSVDSATQITVVRGVGTVAAGAIADTTVLYEVGNAQEEGSLRPSSQYITPARVTNYTQIFRNSWSLTGTLAATQVIAGDTTVAENRQDCAMFHSTDIEQALFFGQKFLGTRNGKPLHTMDGIYNIVATNAPTNITTLGATTNYTQLEAALDPMLNVTTDPKTSNERVMFVGGVARRVLNNIGRLNGTYQLQDGQTSFGLQFTTFKTARGTFRMIEHPLFNSNANWAKMTVVLDMAALYLAYLRNTSNQEFNLSGTPVDNGIDAVGGTLTTELTMELTNPAACGILLNATAAAQG